MSGAHAENVLFVIGLAAAAVGFILIVFLANRVLSPHNPTPEKGEPYECGMPQAGQPLAAVRVRFAAVGLLLVVFDAEAAMLFGVASGLRGSPTAVAAVGVFIGVLTLGLVYAWRKGALEWR
ncbi:MAG: NADH-quinone oxidoreductase subunit A [Coriobacteriia bacterium]|jgi:NADH-quinone oxidoreductase subunit A|nr:NADH-quinone oxidoreductase subunit A [Coriobacteriia bacterium]